MYPFHVLRSLNRHSTITDLHIFLSLCNPFLLAASWWLTYSCTCFRPSWGSQNVRKCCQQCPVLYFFIMAQLPAVGQGLLIVEDSCWHSDTLRHTQTRTHTHSVGLLWKSDQPNAGFSTWQHATLTRDRHPCPPGGIRTRIPSKWMAVDPLLRPRDHWDRRLY